MKVVPEPSARRTGAMSASGSATPGFNALMAGSVHLVILPKKMSPSTWPVSLSWPGSMPLTLITGTTPPMTVGNCSWPFFARSSSFRGMSDAPNATVLESICLMPAPEPTDW